ncbi:MAG TPA: hypothetical protein VE650_06520, partial [Acetobacteraceae bacterium]|nr:hypothetical protein [Acetobacteraceae bacterium]
LSQEMLAALLFVDAPVALAALPGFERRLEGMRRVPNVVWIEPLGLEDVARFVAARFRSAGRPPALLDPEAVLRLARYSEGVPARLQRLAGAAVFFADLECAPRIGCDHVELAAAVGRGLRGAARPVPALPAARPLRSKPLQARLAPLAAAVAGFALVGATSWTARWMGGHAESAQTEPADGPAMELAAGPGALEASVAVAAGPKPDEVPLRPEERRVTGESGFDAEFSLSKTELEEGVGLMAGSLGAAGVRSGIEPDQGLETPGELGAFRGRVHNETLGLSGKLSVVLVRTGTGVKARFHAWDGLLGTGELAVKTSADGRIAASGQLLMGKNPFLCSLNGVIRGNRFIGRAEFVRPWGGPVAHSSFDLLRSES